MQDYRHRPRRNTPYVVKAFDTETGQLLGRVVDITADGMMIVTKQALAPDRTFHLRITLPVMVRHRTDVTVEARVIWCEQDTSPGFCKIGVQFVNIPGEYGFLLEDVMHKLKWAG